MKQIVGLFVSLIAVMFFAAWIARPENSERIFGPQIEDSGQEEIKEKVIVKIDDVQIEAEVADSPGERAKGLSGRRSLGEGKGMLFVFEEKDVRAQFWMKDMNFPIDIIWIDDGEVVHIDKNAQPVEAGTPEINIPLFTANQTIDYVLEIKAGEADRLGIEVGENVSTNY